MDLNLLYNTLFAKPACLIHLLFGIPGPVHACPLALANWRSDTAICIEFLFSV